jgi:hypothetical protein
MGVLILLRNALVMAWALWILVPDPRTRLEDARAPASGQLVPAA